MLFARKTPHELFVIEQITKGSKVVLKVTGSSAVVTLEDGNGHVRARQVIPYTDFPIPHYTLYACWNSSDWVLMLPSEY